MCNATTSLPRGWVENTKADSAFESELPATGSTQLKLIGDALHRREMQRRGARTISLPWGTSNP